jgi:RimJ/RimL family protein N-acetyltransferase
MVITSAAGPAQAGGRAAVPARVGVSAPSGLFAAMAATAGLATGRWAIGAPVGRRFVLRDGSAVLIRQVRSTDAALLADGFGRLSAASRQMRFLGVKKELSAAELRYFTDVDHHDHEALAALDGVGGQGVGIARYVRDAGDPQAAEIAVTIVDDWQGRGLGTELLAALSDRARQEGIRRLTALADAGNVAVAALLRNVGARLVRRGRGTVEYEITLARGEGSEACVSWPAGQAAPGAISAVGSPGPERECALSRATSSCRPAFHEHTRTPSPRVISCAWPKSGRAGETVAGAAHRLQASGTVTEFATEGADHDLDDVAATAPVVAPYVAQQRRPADDPAFAFVQVLQDIEFQLGEIGAGTVEDELAAVGIERGCR